MKKRNSKSVSLDAQLTKGLVLDSPLRSIGANMARRILLNIKNFRELASKEFSYIRRLTLKVERRLKKPPED